MCRMVGYIGGPLPLAELVQKAPHSLYVQSSRPREMTSGVVNADGWGAALWLPDGREEPALYRSSQPIWADANLALVSERLSATPEGWGWRAENSVEMPLGWLDALPDAPVTCISWYEADAYARWRGGRLPTEEEWGAARRIGMPGWGEVWEWTSSWFAPYPGFRAYPYDEYSSRWFGTHKVLRGGSWATHPRLERPSFRNWYEPGFRETPGGLRCAGGL